VPPSGPIPPCAPGSHEVPGRGCVVEANAQGSTSSPVAGPVPVEEGCPAIGNLDTIYAIDWAPRFSIPASVASRAKGIAGVAAETRTFANEIEAELHTACVRMGIELGAKERPTKAAGACEVAAEALKQMRAKIVAPARVAVSVRPPVCTTSLDGLSECAEKCDPAFNAKAALGCEGHAPVGKCDGACGGGCEPVPPGNCPGTCVGRCDTGFHGTCKGTCNGTCNGKAMAEPGACNGTCEGACDGQGRGTCKASCVGACETKTETCPGVCLGHCASPPHDLRCIETFRTAKLGAECGAYCETRLDHKATCSAARIDVAVTGASDPLAASSFKNSVEHNAASIMRVALGLKSRLARAESNAAIVTAGIKAMTQGADAEANKAVAACLNTYAGPVMDASASLKANNAAAAAVMAQLR
jgi:hypothetical protein